MSHILNHFSLQAGKWNAWVLLSLIIIWAGVIGCVISSIFAQPFDLKQRVFWIAVVIALPMIGVLSYLPFSFRKEDLPHIFARKKKRAKKGRDSHSSVEL